MASPCTRAPSQECDTEFLAQSEARDGRGRASALLKGALPLWIFAVWWVAAVTQPTHR
ncbi:hypothetical protein SLNWT_6900 [Streptomyces albus]|uniref:Uncharacterized protein n=1 Tax=Streptomyces albus (strain ATCC 21838 / DSM 41398 / FERM P-419 / JCM 4703 / NBRC 107858) TaxID=1081613 RepID=A0A0B5F8T0_STRA4|nr:hypothetical protein SLNWT_6900 [Streptomyces albus]AOU81579.1 hypothetical protein SLNHY_6888 [Streptomyces albus]